MSKKQQVVNLNQAPISVAIDKPGGAKDYVTVQPRSKVTLEEGHKVNSNWLATVSKVQVNNIGDE